MLLAVGVGLSTVNVRALELPVPELLTVTETLPAVAISAALMVALTCVASSMVAAWLVPPKWITAPLTKFVPVMLSVKALSPAILLAGESALIVGVGLSTVNVRALELPVPG